MEWVEDLSPTNTWYLRCGQSDPDATPHSEHSGTPGIDGEGDRPGVQPIAGECTARYPSEMKPLNVVILRSFALGILVAIAFGCASGNSSVSGLLEPHGDQPCAQISAGHFPIDPTTVVDRDPIQAWLTDWASTVDDEAPGGLRAVISLRMVQPEPDEESEPVGAGDVHEESTPVPPSDLGAFVTETSLDPEEASDLVAVVREARMLDHPRGGIPARLRLEIMRSPSGEVHLTPMVSSRCPPAVADARKLSSELIRAARGARSTGSTITATLFVDESGRVQNLELSEATPGFEGRMALVETLMQARFHPALIDGHPVPNWVTLPVNMNPPRR